MSRAILQVFENYQSARSQFVQTVAELAHRPQNIEALQNADVMALLRPLLLDTVPSIQQSAALALGRLANYSESLAEAVVMNDVLPQLVYSLTENNRYYKKTAAFVLKAVAKHSPQLASSVVEAGSLDALVSCLSEFEPSVKESAAWALGYISQHTPELAQSVVDAGSVPQLILCLQEPELSLKRIAASTLAEIAKHSPELSQIIVDGGAVPFLASMINHPDTKLKRQICSALAQIAKHSVDLAEVVVEAEIFPKMYLCLRDNDSIVRRNSATAIREIAKHTPELAQLIVNSGGHSAIVQYAQNSKGASRLPGLMALGYIAAFNETLATAIIVKQGLIPLKDALINETEDHIKAAAAWSIGQLGRHSPDHSKAVAQADLLRILIGLYEAESSSADLKTKCQKALKSILSKCTHLPALEPLLSDAPEKINKYIIQQFAKVLPNNPQARKSFVTSRALAKIQELKNDSDKDKKLQEFILTINSCYPPEIVQFYSPGYVETLVQKLPDN
jgi:HEAT repeat protein